MTMRLQAILGELMTTPPPSIMDWERSSTLICGMDEYIEPAWIKISEADAEGNDECWDELPEGTRDTLSAVGSAGCVAYISCM